MTPTGDDFHALVAAAAAHHRAGKLDEAESAYRMALARFPDHAAILNNLGTLEAERGRLGSAISLFEQAIAREPNYASAHYNRAAALESLGRVQDAIRGYRRACAIEPDNYAAHRALAFLWLAEGERGRALDHFARTYELRRGDDRGSLAARSLTHSTRAKLDHDAEQFEYLARGRREARRFESLARLYREAARAFPEEQTELSPEQLNALGEDYNTAIHLREAPELPTSAVAGRPDRSTVTERFLADRPHAATIDDLLTPSAFDDLRRYLLESTIWHDFAHIGGFVAAYLEDGLACPLLLQIVDELRAALPDILGPHPLTQAWAFKALAPHSAIAAHSDDGRVSLNLWLTPDGANRNPGRGGLIVCRAVPPGTRPMTGYAADRDRNVAFLEQHAADIRVIPYAANRAVLFDSRLVHASDAPYFATGYENHRINLTLVFGRRSAPGEPLQRNGNRGDDRGA